MDRRPQHIPLPLGGMATAHRRRRIRLGRSAWGRRLPSLVAGVGMVAALAGAALALTPPDVEVFRHGSIVRVGGSVLRTAADDPDTLTGDATLVLRRHLDGTIRAAAVTTVGGRPAAGTCLMVPGPAGILDERCDFTVGSRRFRATDHLDARDGARWRRRYEDGGEATISVSPDGSVIPVPFPVGR